MHTYYNVREYMYIDCVHFSKGLRSGICRIGCDMLNLLVINLYNFHDRGLFHPPVYMVLYMYFTVVIVGIITVHVLH